jgi:Asp-tRNA(Asn)/Glu-tRNA(Gln) amidotransferase A subunit family amidase
MSLLYRPATEIVRLIASGELSAVDAVTAHLAQIEKLNPTLNAFVDVRADHTLAEARAQDAAAAAGTPRGPLGGLPITIKSAIEVAGLRCETGSPSRRGTVAATDAVVVSRLRAAGAIVIGTTNVAEMLMAYESDNPLYGRTANPWAHDRTAGGSSGGESAAIAAGCSAGGIGSDGGGSIRVPAHFTGICGLKPTPGRIPGTGHQPPCLGPFSLIGVVGPMARTVADVDAMFRAIAGADIDDPMTAPIAAAAVDRGSLTGLRVGYFEDDGRVPVTGDTRSAVRAAAQAAAASGCRVHEMRPSGLDRARELWEIFFCEIAMLVLEEPLAGAAVALPILREYLSTRTRTPLSAASFTTAWIERDLARADLLRQMETHRILICPVASIPAFRHGERAWSIDGETVRYLDAMSYTQWFNILGNPVAVVPVGRSAEGLPIGVQVVGRPFEEELVLAVAAAIERGCQGYHPPTTLL